MPKLPASVATSVLLSKWICYKRGQRQRREKTRGKRKIKEMWSKQQTKYRENLCEENISIETSENGVSKPHFHIYIYKRTVQ